MKKFVLFTLMAILLLGILSGCSDRGNVSSNKDGIIEDAGDLVEDATGMLTEMTTERRTTEATTEEMTTEEMTTGEDVGESSGTEESTGDNARSRRAMPRR